MINCDKNRAVDDLRALNQLEKILISMLNKDWYDTACVMHPQTDTGEKEQFAHALTAWRQYRHRLDTLSRAISLSEWSWAVRTLTDLDCD